MILVTGGTGLVGSHLLCKLAGEDTPIRAIYRTERKLERVKKIFGYYTDDPETLFNNIEWVLCPLDDIVQLEAVFKGITHVYHCAAFISFDPTHLKKLLKTNQEGTANIVNLCLSHNIKKLCYVSSIATIGSPTKEKMATEETEFIAADANVYALSKHMAELEVWRASQEGLDVVIVNPGVILGPGHWYRGSGTFFSRLAKKQKFHFPGVTGFVSVKDVTKAMINAMRSSIKNQRFIVISENLSFQEIQSKIASHFGIPPAKKSLKKWMLELFWRLDWLRCKLTGSRRVLSKDMAKTLLERTYYSNEKIKTALGLEFEPMDKTIPFCCSLYLKERA